MHAHHDPVSVGRKARSKGHVGKIPKHLGLVRLEIEQHHAGLAAGTILGVGDLVGDSIVHVVGGADGRHVIVVGRDGEVGDEEDNATVEKKRGGGMYRLLIS